MKRRDATVALGIALLLVTSARADWPHLRGPNYDSVSTETGLAETWPETGPPRLWVRELGQGHSGFILGDGKLFTQRQTLGGQFLVCLDPNNGQTIWETRYDWPWQPRGAYPGPYATPTYYRGKIYFASPSGLVGCMDARTGANLWSLNVRDKFDGKGYGFGCAATLLVEDERVILPVGGPRASLVALHVDDGRTLWATGSDPASYCPALPITLQGRRCVVGYLENALVVLESSTGKLLHRQELSVGYDEHSAWPLYQEPHLLLTGPFRVAATRLTLQPGPEGLLQCLPNWTSRELSNDIASSALYDGHIYGFDLKQAQASKHRPARGVFKCLEWSTGKVCWGTEQVGQASPLIADGKLFLMCDSGSLIMGKADPAAYHELARVQLFDDEICWTPPTLWQGRLFVRNPSQAICLYVGRPENMPKNVNFVKPGPSHSSWRFDSSLLLAREREYPNDAFTWEELSLWFVSCLILIVVAALGTGAILYAVQRMTGLSLAWTPFFWGAVFVLGWLGPNVFSSLLMACLFTWPLSLYAAFHLTVLAYCRAQRDVARAGARWLARLAVVALIIVCLAYYELCQSVGMFIAWCFLFGLLPSFPLAYVAARAAINHKKTWLVACWTLLAFAGFFWSCLGFLWWKEI
jgi:outer membrane protein assembly factor BamB